MKVIRFEEDYGLLLIHDAALKANDPYAEVLGAMRKSGQFTEDLETRTPAGIYPLAERRIAAMDDAGIDVQILSYATPRGAYCVQPDASGSQPPQRSTTGCVDRQLLERRMAAIR